MGQRQFAFLKKIKDTTYAMATRFRLSAGTLFLRGWTGSRSSSDAGGRGTYGPRRASAGVVGDLGVRGIVLVVMVIMVLLDLRGRVEDYGGWGGGGGR